MILSQDQRELVLELQESKSINPMIFLKRTYLETCEIARDLLKGGYIKRTRSEYFRIALTEKGSALNIVTKRSER